MPHLHHLALRVVDPEIAARFYSGVLGLSEARRKVVDGTVMAVWLRLGDAMLMLERELRGKGAATGSGHLVALAVDDLVTWETRLARMGIAIEDRTEHTLYVRDPDGHRVGLSYFVFET
jgi:catechol 2,3-dioxygenase-like lactoylglutathione lyase family enzyme